MAPSNDCDGFDWQHTVCAVESPKYVYTHENQGCILLPRSKFKFKNDVESLKLSSILITNQSYIAKSQFKATMCTFLKAVISLL